jgi:hypothetical protein
MDKIYVLSDLNDKRDSSDSLIGRINDDLFHLIIEKKLEENQIHRYIVKSFKYCTIKSNDSPLKALLSYGEIYSRFAANIEKYKLTEITTKIGEYYPRIHRPFIETKDLALSRYHKVEQLREEIFQYPDYIPNDKTTILSAVNQLAALKEMLIVIFNVTHPCQENLQVFGNSIKNLLVLSCIEVETQLKGIYRLHESSPCNNYTTNHYVKLNKFMKLDKYNVKLPFYQDLNLISPFKKWSVNNPTKSLVWYDSYNAIKHNSEIEFHKASLENAIYAICAVAVLIKAQYGNNIPFWNEKIGTFFEIINESKWHVKDRLLPPLTGNKWESKRIDL